MQNTFTSEDKLKNIKRISKLMDSQFKIGSFKFGLDPIINLIPFLGDGISVIISGLMVYTMTKHGASGKILVKMILNVIIDAVVGAIPVLGWIFDFYFKANDRNLKLLTEHYEENKHTGSGKGLLATIAISLLLLVMIIIFLIWKISVYLFEIIVS
jgi:hypothetical protein